MLRTLPVLASANCKSELSFALAQDFILRFIDNLSYHKQICIVQFITKTIARQVVLLT